jgi:hypothetical protein
MPSSSPRRPVRLVGRSERGRRLDRRGRPRRQRQRRAHLRPQAPRTGRDFYQPTPIAAELITGSLPSYLLTAGEVSALAQTRGLVAGTLTDALTDDGAVAPRGCPNAWAPADWTT